MMMVGSHDGGPDPPATPARPGPGTPAASPSSNTDTPIKLVKVFAYKREPQTPGRAPKQTTLNFAATRATSSPVPVQFPEEGEMSLVPVTNAASHEDTVCKTPAPQALLDKARTEKENASLIDAVVQEQMNIFKSAPGKRKPGELAPLPLNARGKKAAREARTGRPADPLGPRVGRQGYLTPGQTSNTRPAEQVVLRRDCTAPNRLRMALAVEAQGVHEPRDLKQVLPETWRQLEMRFARPCPS